MNSRNKRGFTLIELLAVVAVIGILAAITMRLASNASQHAAYAQTVGKLEHIEQWLEEYYNLYGEYPDVADGAHMLWENPNSGLKPDDWDFIMSQAAIYSPGFNQQENLPMGLCWWFGNRTANHMQEYRDKIGIAGMSKPHSVNTTDLGFEYGEVEYTNSQNTVRDAWGNQIKI